MQRRHFPNKGLCSQSYGFSSSHGGIWELEHKEGWTLKNWCLWIVVLKKTLESPLDCKEIKPANPKENQSWILEGLMLKLQYFGYLPDTKSRFIGRKNLMLWKIEFRKRRGWQRMRWSDGIIDSTDMVWANSGRGWMAGKPGVLESMSSQSWAQLSD